MSVLAFRIAARYQRWSFDQTSIEFDSPEAMQKYLQEHPGADKAKHHVKKPGEKPQAEEAPKPEGHGEHGEGHGEHKAEPKKTFKQRLESLSQKTKSFLSNAPSEIKKFVSDDAHRRETLQTMHKFVEKIPEKVYSNAKHAIKHEIEEFKTAGQGIKAVLKGGKMTHEQKHAVKAVAFDAALTLAVSAVTGGLGAGASGLAAHTVSNFAKSLAKKLALNTVTHGLGHVTKIEELGHFGHGIHHMLEHVLTAAEDEKKGDESDLIMAYISKLLADELKDLDPDTLAEALEEAANAEKDGKEAAVKKRRSTQG
jgi:hypothetical protein